MISHLESACVSNEDIHNNILISHEIFPILKEKGKFLLYGNKARYEKAYDRLEMDFLRNVFRA